MRGEGSRVLDGESGNCLEPVTDNVSWMGKKKKVGRDEKDVEPISDIISLQQRR